jgi:hypothetical protein
MQTVEAVFDKIDKQISPFQGYKESLLKLKSLPPGFGCCFAFHYVDADICNGGISQLYANSTWSLLLTAIAACQHAGTIELEHVLKQIVLYYHQKGRSRFKKQLSEDFFEGLERPMNKSLSELDDEYFALESERQKVVGCLVKTESLYLWGEA